MENEVKDLEIQYEISKEEIKKLIYTIRGKQVMIDKLQDYIIIQLKI